MKKYKAFNLLQEWHRYNYRNRDWKKRLDEIEKQKNKTIHTQFAKNKVKEIIIFDDKSRLEIVTSLEALEPIKNKKGETHANSHKNK